MRHILYATDFSNSDQTAFHQACVMAAAWKAKLLILHVDSSSGSDFEISESDRELRHVVPVDLAIDFQHIHRTGNPVDIILEIEKEQDVDLIVLGTHGRKGIKRWFKGSVAESIIRAARCPVMTQRIENPRGVVRKHPPDYQPRILVSTDFSLHSYVALDFASSMAKALNGMITILHVDESMTDSDAEEIDGSPEKLKQRQLLWEQLKKVEPKQKGIQFTHKMLNSPAAQNISNYVNEKDYDYIVLGTHGRSGVGRALMGSVTENVVRNTDCPVITVKPSNKLNPDLRHARLSKNPTLT